MKTILMLIGLSVAMTSFAKLSDFNDIIEENVKAQNELHSDLTTNLSDTKLAVQNEKRERYLVDTSSSINVPTKKSFLTFAKEKNYFRASEKQAKKRLAVEVESAD